MNSFPGLAQKPVKKKQPVFPLTALYQPRADVANTLKSQTVQPAVIATGGASENEISSDDYSLKALHLRYLQRKQTADTIENQDLLYDNQHIDLEGMQTCRQFLFDGEKAHEKQIAISVAPETADSSHPETTLNPSTQLRRARRNSIDTIYQPIVSTNTLVAPLVSFAPTSLSDLPCSIDPYNRADFIPKTKFSS